MVQGILRVRMKIPKIEALKEFLEIKKWKPCEPEFRFYSGRDAWKPFYTGDGYYDFKKWNVDFLTWKVETVNWGSNLVIIALFKPQRVLNGLI